MKRTRIVSLLLVLCLFTVLLIPAQSAYTAAELNEEDIIYMLMTDRFYDGDSTNNGTLGEEYRPGNMHYYQGGDWEGLIEKLDYIADMGFTALWISAPQENEKYSRSGDESGYHGYYTKDFNEVNPYFGTEEQLQELIDEAAARGLKVIIDAQLNHTADYLEYPSTTYSPSTYKPDAPFDNPSWYHNNPNISDFTDEYQLHNYSLGGLDDLAQENGDCWDALMDAYWNPVSNSGWFSYGFAGSRVDAVMEIPEEYLTLYEEHTGKNSFGEAYTGSVDDNSVFQNYMWSVLDFPLYFQMNEVFCKGTEWGGVKWVFDQDYKYRDANSLITFIDNHDRPRFLGNAADNYASLRLALAFMYSVRGVPVVYYGTEQNMAGDFTYSDAIQNDVNRQMMAGFSQTGTTYQYLQRLNQIRKDYSEILTKGTQRELYYSYGDSIYAISRRCDWNGDEIISVFNNSATAQTRTINLNPGTTSHTVGTYLTDLLNTDTVIRVQEGATLGSRYISVTVPANSAVMLTNGYPEEYRQPSYQQTTVIVHYDAGFGNYLSIRGNTEPLNWSSGQKCQNVSSDTWQYVMERPASGNIEFKILLNDTAWETGSNHVVTVGNTVHVWPSF